MSTEKHKTITRSSSVCGNIGKEGSYIHNINLGVEAMTMEQAIAAVRSMYPTIHLVSCHHRGDVHIIVPPSA